jgi:predicted acylesterase/phospholipase RssA
MRTEYFSSCAAVFEGGGVRGAAYAGAYAAAVNSGMRFNRVAGSSAGSIAAAFIAAGGTPEMIKAKLLGLDLASLQRSPDDKDVPYPRPNLFTVALTKIPNDLIRQLGLFIRYSGAFSSIALRDWIEASLREMLASGGNRPLERPVRFSDLNIPLYIVAADVLQKVPKVWSLDSTPEDSVAFAVQASCAIPFYFQPVINAQSVFVDGGTISNLPSHVVLPRAGHPGRFADKTLAFRLKASPSMPKARFDNAKDYAFSIADTVVASATLIQQSLQDRIYPIEIGTGEIRSNDFKKMTPETKALLFANGQRAVEDFVRREREVAGSHQIATVYTGYDERLLAYVFAISHAKESIWFSDSSTYWLFFIYPIIATAVARGVSVKVMAQDPPTKDPDNEAKRRASLVSLGCDVVSVAALTFTGLVVDYPSSDSIAVITSEHGMVGQDFEYLVEQVRLYRSQDDLPVIRNLGNALATQVGAGGKSSGGTPTLKIIPLRPSDLYAGLRRVRQYADASFDIDEVPFNEGLRVSQTHIKEFKLLQIETLVRELEQNGIDLFAPCTYRLQDGSFSTITPPVLEITPHGPVIIEGHTRAFYMAQLGRERFQAVLVSGVHEPLPVTPRAFSDMQVAHITMTASTMLPNYDKGLFRYIEAALHP